MNATDLVVIGLCVAIILIGVAVLRLSASDRVMGVVGIALGTVALVAWLAAGDAPPADRIATPALLAPGTPGTPAGPATGP